MPTTHNSQTCSKHATYIIHYITNKKSVLYISCNINHIYTYIHTYISVEQCKSVSIACHVIQQFISSDIHYDNAYQRTYNTIYAYAYILHNLKYTCSFNLLMLSVLILIAKYINLLLFHRC